LVVVFLASSAIFVGLKLIGPALVSGGIALLSLVALILSARPLRYKYHWATGLLKHDVAAAAGEVQKLEHSLHQRSDARVGAQN
jgi:hypothetical protein